MRKPQRCPEDLWRDLARRDASAVFFQSPEWHALALRDLRRRGVAGAESHPLLFDWDNGRAVMPLLRVPGRLHETFQSPFGTYTALLSADPVPAPALAEIAGFLRGRNVELFSSPHSAHPVALKGAHPNATYVVDLSNVDVTQVEMSWANNQRRHWRNGVRAGLTVRTAAGPEDVAAYYRVYEKTLERWGGKARSRYAPEFFRDLWDTLGGDGPMRLWLAESGGRVVGGDVCFYHNRHAVQWHGVVDAEFFKAGATQALLHAIIGDAARRGFSVYDMNPSGGLAAVESFKKDFGSRRVEFLTYRNLVFPWSWARGLQERLFRR